MTNTEPQGVKDLREAKADYLASLSKLREADAEKVKAEATVKQAEAEVQKAIAAQNQALAEAQQIANEAASIANEEAAARAKAAIDTIKAKAELDAVKAQEALAKAQAELDKALRKIAAEAIGLTTDEAGAITTKTTALETAYTNYNTALANKNAAAQTLWQVEYNVATGKDNYETVESYKAKIADEEDNIAEAKAEIATLEALKKTPSAVKDTIDALKAKQQDLKIEKQNAVNEKSLYEASIFVEAKREYTKRWNKFVEDSIGTVEPFKFVDVDEDGKDVPKEYELTDGKKVDQTFGFLINNYWEESRKTGEWSSYSDIFNLKYDGFNYNTEKNAVEVGVISFYDEEDRHWQFNASPEALTEGLDVLDKIVETLNRDMVVVDNLADSTTVEEAKKAAHVADSVFDAHYAILKDGLEKYQPLIDSQAVVKAKDSDLTAAKAVLAQKVANFNADSNAVVTAIKGVSAELIVAAEEFAAATNNIRSSHGGFNSISKDDSARFIAAAVTLGKAKAKYFGVQDSIELIEVNLEGARKPYGVPFSELNASGFVQTVKVPNGVSAKGTSLYGGTGYGAYKNSSINELKDLAYYPVNENYKATDLSKDAFTKVVRTAGVSGYTWTKDISPKEVLYAGTYYKKESPVAYDMCSWTDTVKWYKNFVGTEAKGEKKGDFAKVVVKAAYDQMDASKAAVETAKEETVKAYNAVEKAKKGVEKATIAYQTIYKSFWGITENLNPETKKECVKPQKFTWTKKTFLEPTNCVKFWCEYNDILSGSTLETILKNVDPEGYWNPEEQRANYHTIFRSNERNWTEFAQALIAAQKAEDLGDYVPNKARLEKINAQVAQIREDVEAAIAEYEAATEGLEEIFARFYGVDEDGNQLLPVRDLAYATIVDGKWTYSGKPLGGYQLAWAEELAPEYAKIVKDYNDTVAKVDQKLKDIEDFITALETAYVAWAGLDNPDLAGAGNLANIIAYFDSLIKTEEGKITAAEKEIKILNEAVAKCEAGYSPAEVEVAYAKAKLAEAERLLKQAEEALARAKKEYNEVIAKYGVNE